MSGRLSGIISPMPRGSGAIIVHETLAARMAEYQLVPYSPWLTLVPPLLRLTRGEAAGVVHTTPDHAIFLARRTEPLVVTFHGYVLDAFMRRYSGPLQALHYRTDLRWFVRRALDRASAVTAVSEFTAQLVRDDMGYRGQIEIIPNGVDIQLFKPGSGAGPGESVRVLFSGNLRRAKGVGLLPEIARRVHRNVTLWCTAGLRESAYRRRSAGIELLPPRPHEQMPDLYRGADILVMPTHREGMSLAVLEAMACGLPVVATRGVSIEELIVEGQGGYFCDAGNASDFAEKINALARSPSDRQRMGAYNRARVEERFTAAHMVAGYEALFDRVLAEASGC